MADIKKYDNPSIISIPDLVINYHVTEACNYGCKYCYARWKKASDNEIHRDMKKTIDLFSNLKVFFNHENNENPLSRYLKWENIRLNFAGGEPFFIGKRFYELIEIAKDFGFKISIITNGSLINDEFISSCGPKLSMIGMSIDSGCHHVMTEIGRCNRRFETLDFEYVSRNIKLLKSLNEAIKIKVNTVVNSLNWQENMGNIIDEISPDKWKILQVLPILDDELSISDEQFEFFVKMHEAYKTVIVAENNTDMTDSYIMINPQGMFYQNTNSNGGYIYSSNILKTGIKKAFNEINFNPQRFASRY